MGTLEEQFQSDISIEDKTQKKKKKSVEKTKKLNFNHFLSFIFLERLILEK